MTIARRRPLMVLGCTSSAGKSLLTTAIVRWFARRGVDVVPFKAQNMSNNARVVDGGEIGVAQWLQAVAAGVEPDVRMNPVLVKPEGDSRSQVVVDGVVDREISAMSWRDRTELLWPTMAAAFDSLHADHELVVIEGAGSPAEINLPDLANNRTLAHADAAAILVADIDRGGAFAHLFGTWSLVPPSTRERLGGFVLNKFRGDAGLLEPGPRRLLELTSMPCLGVLPMLRHELPDEEGAVVRAHPSGDAVTVAIVRYPYASNLDEFHLLARVAYMRYATTPSELGEADLVILPGSKHVAADAEWLRDRGIGAALVERAAAGRRTLGICGGAMILGRDIVDPDAVEGATAGLAVLPLTTVMRPDKITRRTTFTIPADPAVTSDWAALGGRSVSGYEIRHGRISADRSAVVVVDDLVWVDGPTMATTVHGLLERPDVLAALTGRRADGVLDRTCDDLADAVAAHLDTALLDALTRPP